MEKAFIYDVRGKINDFILPQQDIPLYIALNSSYKFVALLFNH